MMAYEPRSQMIVNVFLSNGPDAVAEVPITPETTCRDIVDCCKEVGEEHCHLAELWRGCERPIKPEERIFDILKQWGIHSNEVKFYLRHQSAKTAEDSSREQDQRMKKNNGTPDDYMIPSGVDLSLNELQDMADRQQHQIEAQQQTLVAKQQRLKFLKQQEQKQQQMVAEDERLRKFREKVDSQEQKLRKLRVLRGQADVIKNSNHTMSTELESVKSLFAQKEKELSLAVARVEELTQQLDQLKKGQLNGLNGDTYKSPANEELNRLRQELVLRNRLNEEQSVTLQRQRQSMFHRKEEMAVVDKRIEELTERLRNSRSLGKPHLVPRGNANNNASGPGIPNGLPLTARPRAGGQGEAERRSPVANGDFAGHPPLPSGPPANGSGPQVRPVPTGRPMPPKPASLLPPQGFKPRTGQGSGSGVPRQGSPMSAGRPPNNNHHHHQQHHPPSAWHSTSLDTFQQSRGRGEGVNESGSDTSSLTENSSVDSVPTSGLPHNQRQQQQQQPGPIRSPDNRSSPVNQRPGSPKTSQPPPIPMAKADPRLMSLSDRRAGDRSPMYNLANLEAALSPPPQDQMGDRAPFPSAVGPGPGPGNPPLVPAYGNPNQTETDFRSRSSSVDSLGQPVNGGGRQLSSPQSKKKPPPPPRSVNTGLSAGQAPQLAPGSPSRGGPPAPNGQRYPSVPNQQPPSPSAPPRTQTEPMTHPGSPKLSSGRSSGSSSPIVGPALRAQSGSPGAAPPGGTTKPPAPAHPDVPPPRPELPLPYAVASTAPAPDPTRPRHQRSPATVGMFAPPPPAQLRNYNRPSYEKGFTAADGGAKKNLAVRSLFPDAQPNPPGQTLPGSIASQPGPPQQPSHDNDKEEPPSPNRPSSPLNVPMSHLYHHPDIQRLRNMPRPLKKRLSYSEDKESLNFLKIGTGEPPAVAPGNSSHRATGEPQPKTEPEMNEANKNPAGYRSHAILSQKQYTAALSQLSRSPVISNRSTTGKGLVRGILKKEGAPKKTIRVRFDPLALLLDASLEGEFELVRRIMPEVPNPSGANDEGITALHNAICANHYEIVNFLITNGVDVNAPDSDGWTPLHCAASCNNVIMVRNLVEHGACIFATTITNKETAADKCEEEEDGFKMCSQYLVGVQEKMGMLNGGRIFAVYSYAAEKPDELSFKDGEELTVLRRGDDMETEWWWAKKGEQLGYIPRNLFGLFPRVKPLF